MTDDPWSSCGGVIEIAATSGANLTVFDGSASPVTMDGFIVADAGARLELLGTIDNEGTLAVLGKDAQAKFDHADVTNEADAVIVADGRRSKVEYSAGVLTNLGFIVATQHGAVALTDVKLDNKGEMIADDGRITITDLQHGKRELWPGRGYRWRPGHHHQRQQQRRR